MKEGVVYKIGMQEGQNSDFLKVEAHFLFKEEKPRTFRFPFWRPGRYEAGNFEKLIRDLQAFTPKGEPILQETLDQKHFVWKESKLCIRYEIWAGDLNAGSCYADPRTMEGRLQINPIQACIMSVSEPQIPCNLEVEIPEGWSFTTGLEAHRKENTVVLEACSFDQLVDEPFLAAPNLLSIDIPGTPCPISLIVVGNFPVNNERIAKDLGSCCQWQWNAFGGLDVESYRFLLQTTRQKAHHGVEHETNNLCVLGPDKSLGEEGYEELLSLFSHEFYHAWNVKRLRPASWMPYPLHREAPEPLSLIAEGVTTYMGEMALVRCGLYDESKALKDLSSWWQRHSFNPGRLAMDLLEAGNSTWIDGYGNGARARRMSIYSDGALASFILDLRLLTDNPSSGGIQGLMKHLYANPTLRKNGYTLADYLAEIERLSGKDSSWYLKEVLKQRKGLDELLEKSLEALGYSLSYAYPWGIWEHHVGIRFDSTRNKIMEVAPDSPAALAGLRFGDVWETGQPELMPGKARYGFKRLGISFEVEMEADASKYFAVPEFESMKKLSADQMSLRKLWLGIHAPSQ